MDGLPVHRSSGASSCMAMALQQVLLLLLLGLFLIVTHSQNDPTFVDCPTDSNYTTPSTFATNLALLLPNLTITASNSPTLFSTSFIGSTYGLAQCRPDASSDDCATCLNRSAISFSAKCPSRSNAAIRFDLCLLRYSSSNFFSLLDDSLVWSLVNVGNASDPTVFNRRLDNLMDEILPEASQTTSRFSVGTNLSDSEDIYAMLQCTRDLSAGSCEQCLNQVIKSMRSYCSGKIGCQILTVSCFVRYETQSFFSSSLLSPPPPPPASSPPPPPANGGTQSTESGVRKAQTGGVRGGDEQEFRSAESLLFDLSTIREATDDFSDDNKLGEGGFGPVYKGMLRDGQEIAVKRLARTSTQGFVELKNEVLLVAKLQHKNLVRLLGCCLEEGEKLLVYEYLRNASLDKFLFDPTMRGQLDWTRRYKIIEGIGRGLLYLHEDSRLRIIHRDLKASNILLDEDITPKISDFGFAKLFGIDETQGNTSRIAGTYGYMAPEYAMHGLFSVKSDVYSYGVMVLEIVTGRKNSVFQESGNAPDLITTAWRRWNQGKGLELIDPSLGDKIRAEEVLRCIHIGLLCIQEEPTERPTMASVVLMLRSYSLSLPRPSTPAFFMQSYTTSESNKLSRETDPIFLENEHANEGRNRPRLISSNDLSISETEAR
ncbi:putative receptor-like protein kinase At4g00960 isoform X2 [Dioscorea cayenensis subsp. rotundata]|uniref:Receptor-like protein kinase At4g00960 isoform X2 n=1 Tax=Dioscorea cayennensis subsp. rotundata TaxID=55577 RepID=A0AB40ATS3_DIOCR|nr:putative receptor-like protein kinase At4g00960 isoform X2 [Dioscorea cayenensis subsp. rotundata]